MYGVVLVRYRSRLDTIPSRNSIDEINEAIERIRNNPNGGATCAIEIKTGSFLVDWREGSLHGD